MLVELARKIIGLQFQSLREPMVQKTANREVLVGNCISMGYPVMVLGDSNVISPGEEKCGGKK